MRNVRQRKGKKGMWVTIGIIAGAVVVILAAAAFLCGAPGQSEKTLTMGDVDFTRLRDGVYVGEYSESRYHLRDTKVEVTIARGEITGAKILKGAVDAGGDPKRLKDGLSVGDLFDRAIKGQTLQVDVISGATITSKTHLKAFENALKKAQAH